jgi:geranylgeranyl diphosphate synthase type II
MLDSQDTLKKRANDQLEIILDRPEVPSPLIDAMRYGVFNGGKRIRPTLVYLACEAFDTDLSLADKPACAIELIHAYSLIHDDLPAMDDDDFRRGKPSCHVEFDEATAILAGDALQAMAFETLVCDTQLTLQARLDLIHELSSAAGASGMVAGQAIDISFENKQVDPVSLENMHRRKTGCLISACLKFAAIISDASPANTAALEQFGQTLGLAFQIRDDILDVIGDEQIIGKPVGSDISNEKSTFVSVYGLDEASRRLDQLLADALIALTPLGPSAMPLRDMAQFIVIRSH